MVYVVLSFMYSYYLSASQGGRYQPDFITYQVAHQAQVILEFLGYNSEIRTVAKEAWVRLYFRNTYICRVIEGCNGVSVIILFSSFIMAFASTLKRTVLFLLAGGVLIYTINVLRIALLVIGLYYYPSYDHILHGVVFPLIIYGLVFLLWVVWVNYVVRSKN